MIGSGIDVVAAPDMCALSAASMSGENSLLQTVTAMLAVALGAAVNAS
jgi:hypothetical protein